jgi:hypothetical protein
MTDRPILFSAPMVRALLDGRKTQTRRVVKGVPPSPGDDAVNPNCQIKHAHAYLDAYCSVKRTPLNPRGMSSKWCWWTRDDRQHLPVFDVRFAPGDRLWVKETWRSEARHDAVKPTELLRDALVSFDADYLQEPNDGCRGRPRVSIHMPRWASRLTLTVRDVRVQRLFEISHTDAMAEGLEWVAPTWGISGVADSWQDDPRMAYRALWDAINGKGAADANPWVVAVTFTVERRNIDA